MTSDPDAALSPSQDPVEPAAVVAAMASAVARVRRMAATVFRGDAALFAGSRGPGPKGCPGWRVEPTVGARLSGPSSAPTSATPKS